MMNKNYIPFVTNSEIYKPSQIKEVLEKSVNEDMLISTEKRLGRKKSSPIIHVYEVPCAFDIETTSFIDDEYSELLRNAEYEEYQSEMDNEEYEYVESVYKAIKRLGGINSDDVKFYMGKELAVDISKKWRGIYRKGGMKLDLLALNLESEGFIEFSDKDDNTPVNALIEWLSNHDRLKKTVTRRVPKIDRSKYKRAVMYEWTFGINGNVIMGRTWKELEDMFDEIVEYLHLSLTRRLIIYVHNLKFDFQFFRKHFEWNDLFAVDELTPAYAVTNNGLEFKCSFLLSGYSLANVAKDLTKYPVKKMTGDLDYSLLRHSLTPLTDAEIKYCENDVRVIMSYIQELLETTDKHIYTIPMTKTGRARKFCRERCLYSSKSHKTGIAKYEKYSDLMRALTLTVSEYFELKEAFQGGFTHANAVYSGEILENVASYDFTSSYPYVMVAEKFPMSKGKLLNDDGKPKSKEEFEFYVKNYCCIFRVRFKKIGSKTNFEHYISESRCVNPELGLYIKGEIIDNGRVDYADELATVITNVDYDIIKKVYTWENIAVDNLIYYEREYLPTDFVLSILELYKDKTTLKGVKGEEVRYLAGKSLLNALYGMCVTDICQDENLYINDEWQKHKITIDEAKETIDKYNKKKNRFLSYAWGVFVTAYARKNLWSGILQFRNDYVYSDTDSVKVLNYERHLDYIERYNSYCKEKLRLACMYHNIPFSMVEPQTIKGEKKLLGVWDFEGIYTRFKTLGAKRYMTEKDGKISITVSGVNKNVAVPYLIETFGVDGTFDEFDNYMKIPAEYTGKNTHTYINDLIHGEITDYKGVKLSYNELSAIYLEPAEYSLSLSAQYINYLLGVREIER